MGVIVVVKARAPPPAKLTNEMRFLLEVGGKKSREDKFPFSFPKVVHKSSSSKLNFIFHLKKGGKNKDGMG